MESILYSIAGVVLFIILPIGIAINKNIEDGRAKRLRDLQLAQISQISQLSHLSQLDENTDKE
jgi:hypothetical protein